LLGIAELLAAKEMPIPWQLTPLNALFVPAGVVVLDCIRVLFDSGKRSCGYAATQVLLYSITHLTQRGVWGDFVSPKILFPYAARAMPAPRGEKKWYWRAFALQTSRFPPPA
jgi:hypothetical protein